jgi:hypothetical protein
MATKATKQEVVTWEEQLAAEAKAVAAQERPPVSKISFKSGVMTYMGNVMPNNELECIALAYSYENVIYASAYDPDNISPPACFAVALPQDAGKDGAQMVPHEVVPEPFHTNCVDCPKKEWGSRGKKGRACGDRRRIAILPASVLKDPDSIPRAEFGVISLPTMSIANWSRYVNTVAAQYSRPFWAVGTKVMLRPDPKTQFKVHFECVGTLPEDVLGPIHKAIEAANRIVLEPYNMETGRFDEPADSKKF